MAGTRAVVGDSGGKSKFWDLFWRQYQCLVVARDSDYSQPVMSPNIHVLFQGNVFVILEGCDRLMRKNRSQNLGFTS